MWICLIHNSGEDEVMQNAICKINFKLIRMTQSVQVAGALYSISSQIIGGSGTASRISITTVCVVTSAKADAYWSDCTLWRNKNYVLHVEFTLPLRW